MQTATAQKNTQQGFIVLYAALVGGIVLTIGLIVYSISFRELILSSQARESHTAFVAADAGMECALYWDLKHPGEGASIFGGAPSGTSISDGLVAYWKLDDGSGVSATDSTSVGNDGNLTNMEDTDWLSAGEVGGALSFNSDASEKNVDEYLDLDNAEGILNPSEGAFAFWLYMPSTSLYDGANQSIIDWAGDAGNYLGFSKNSSNVFVWRYRSGGAHDQVRIINSTQVAAFADTWKHVVVMWDDNGGGEDDLWIYVDGVLAASGPRTVSDVLDSTITKASVAAHKHGASPQNFLVGDMDEVRVYDRVLNQAEINALALKSSAFVNPIGDIDENGSDASDYNCVGANITDPTSGWDPDSGWTQEKLLDEAATTTFDLLFPTYGGCATVTVGKAGAGGVLESRGYNTCDLNDPRRVERALRVTY